MEEQLARQFDEVLERADGGELISYAWLRENYAESADALAELLGLVGRLARPSTPIGTALGPCRLLSEMGRGGMGTVFLAELTEPYRDLRAGRRVAVKVIHGHLAADRRTQQRFMTEGVVGARVRHPNVVSTHGSLRVPTPSGPALCLIMEPVEGHSLAEYQPLGTIAPESLVRFVARGVARGLAAIHVLGIVHRDVKPHNVMITCEHRVVLMDLGVAQVTSTRDGGDFVGSPLYAAPEQLEPDQPVDARADLFALGLTLVELALGVRPATGPPYRLPEPYSPFLREVVCCLTEPLPGDRFDSSRQLVEVLDAAERSEWWRHRERDHEALASADASTSQLHGRDAELDLMAEDAAEIRGGRGRVRLFVGPAGIGKSRLVHEFLRAQQDIDVVKSGYDPDQVTVSQSGVPRALGGIHGVRPGLRELPATLAEAVRAFLRGERPATAVESRAIGDAIARAIQIGARGMAVWIDDLHLAPADHLMVLRAVLQKTPGLRLLIIGTGRPGIWCDVLGGAGGASPRELAPLGDAAVDQVVRDALQPRRLADRLVRTVVRRAAGNPLVALSTVWGLDDHGHFERRADNSWTVSEHVPFDVPEGLEGALRRRFARLTAHEREVVEAAATVGATFRAEEVAVAMNEQLFKVLASIEQLCRLPGLVQPSMDSYRFDHHCLQELLYRETPPAVRNRQHQALAEYHERGGDRLPETSVTICHHAIRGASPDLARRHLLAAINHLVATRQHEHAAAMARDACDVAGLLAGRLRLEVLFQRATILHSITGVHDERREVLYECKEAAALDPDYRWQVRALLELSEAWQSQWHDDEEGLRAADEGLRLLDVNGDDVELRVALTRVRCMHLAALGRNGDANVACAMAVELVNRCDNPRLRLDVRTLSAGRAFHAGDPNVLAQVQHCVRAAEELEDPSVLALPYGYLGRALRDRGELGPALEAYLAADAAAREVGNEYARRFLLGRRGEVLFAAGRFAESELTLRAGLSECMDARDFTEASLQFRFQAQVLRDCGDASRALRDLDRAREMAASTTNPSFLAQADACQATVEAMRGDFDAADELLGRSIDVLGVSTNGEAPTFLLRCAESAALSGARTQAVSWLDRARACIAPDDPRAEHGLVLRAWRVVLCEEPAGELADEIAAAEQRCGDPGRMRLQYLLSCVERDEESLARARSVLTKIVERAPERYADTMIDAVPLYAALRDGNRLD